MSSIWWASRPIRQGITCSLRELATDSSRPLRVASPIPARPWSVSILRVTKLRPGQQTMTRAVGIFLGRGVGEERMTGVLVFLMGGERGGTRETKETKETKEKRKYGAAFNHSSRGGRGSRGCAPPWGDRRSGWAAPAR